MGCHCLRKDEGIQCGWTGQESGFGVRINGIWGVKKLHALQFHFENVPESQPVFAAAFITTVFAVFSLPPNMLSVNGKLVANVANTSSTAEVPHRHLDIIFASG